MARKAARKNIGKRNNIFGPISYSKHLIWVDMEPLLAEERAKCRKASEKVSLIKKQVDEYRDFDEPAYAHWFYSKFGKEITDCREMDERFDERYSLIQAVRFEAMTSDCSEREAYARVMKRRSKPSPSGAGRSTSNPGDELDDRLDGEPEQMSFDTSTDELGEMGLTEAELAKKIRNYKFDRGDLQDLRERFENQMGDPLGWEAEYESLFREYVVEFIKLSIIQAEKTEHRQKRESAGPRREDEKQSQREEAFVPKAKAPQHPEADQIKSIYRTLARKLHPDANPNLTKAELNLWYEVQAAYEGADLVRLESILAMVEQETVEEGGKRGLDAIRSVSRLRLLFKDFEKNLRALRKQVKGMEQSAAWDFRAVMADPKRLKRRTSEIQRDLRFDFEEMHHAVMEMDELVESWARARPRSRGRR